MNKYEKHGFATGVNKKVYFRWYSMIERCHNPKSYSYSFYGGRGIKVCDRWRESILNYIEDMGVPKGEETLDRIDNNGDYCKENCRWATRKEQRNNQRVRNDTLYFTFNSETKTLKEWAKIKNIKYITLYARIKYYKLPPEEVFR